MLTSFFIFGGLFYFYSQLGNTVCCFAESVSKDDVLRQYIDQVEQQLSQYLLAEETSMQERVR